MDVRGVDFSGAARPGEDVWLAEGRLDDGRLRITSCRSAAESLGASARGPVLEALRDRLRCRPGTTGLDCSLGLPADLVPAGVETWTASIRWFSEEFAAADADGMRETLKQRARALDGDGVELKRRTDDAVGANSPYSFITYYQTLYGLRDVLAPLVEAGDVAVPPMQAPGETNVVESYPAGTLRRLDTVDEGYKDGGDAAADCRAEILAALAAETAFDVVIEESVRDRAISEPGGDALDSVVAAVATARAVRREFDSETPYDPLEGCIFA